MYNKNSNNLFPQIFLDNIMQKSVSQTIIDKWLIKLADTDVDPNTIGLLKEIAENKTLEDVKALKGVILRIEEKNAKNQVDSS